MCLTTVQTRWLRAKEDIVCYKLLDRDRFYNPIYAAYVKGITEYRTPFRGIPIKDKVIEGKKCFRAKGCAAFGSGVITEGAIHACATEEKAWDYYKYGSMGNSIFKCIIPKGTRYAVGIDGDICAKKIKFIEKII
jgi:hypothetical protein